MSKTIKDIVVDLSGGEEADEAGVIELSEAAPGADLPKNSRMNENGTITLTLAHKVTLKTKNQNGQISEQIFGELTFRRFTGGDLRAIRNLSGHAMTVEMFARSTGVRTGIMQVLYDNMLDFDITNAGEVMEYFFKNGPTTGR